MRLDTRSDTNWNSLKQYSEIYLEGGWIGIGSKFFQFKNNAEYINENTHLIIFDNQLISLIQELINLQDMQSMKDMEDKEK